MRELSIAETEMVEGGSSQLAIAAVLAVGAMFAFGYMVGKDMAARDDARTESSKQ